MKLYQLFVCFLIVFSSCETDFDVNAEWQDVTIVFGLLDPGQNDQYIKINKAFLGNDEAFEMASVADSSNYDPSNLLVKIYQINEMAFNTYDTVGSPIILDTTILKKDTGLFSADENIIYTFNNDDLQSSNISYDNNSIYALEITNLISDNKVISQTEIINSFSFESTSGNQWGLYIPNVPDSLTFRTKAIKWPITKNGIIYQLDLIIKYTENNNDTSITWSQSLQEPIGSSDMTCFIKGDDFFNFLSNNLSTSTNKDFIGINLNMTIGTSNLKTYMQVNEPFSGIVQERPVFTNINNGLGLFSSRYTYFHSENIQLNQESLDYLETIGLGF